MSKPITTLEQTVQQFWPLLRKSLPSLPAYEDATEEQIGAALLCYGAGFIHARPITGFRWFMPGMMDQRCGEWTEHRAVQLTRLIDWALQRPRLPRNTRKRDGTP